MSEKLTEFRGLLDRVRAGDDDAARALHDQYSPHLRRVVRRQLHQKLRARFDSIDFLQQVWKSFFAGDLGERDFETPEALIVYLGRIAQNKVIDEARRFQSAKREHDARTIHDDPENFAGADPTPSQELIADEKMQDLLSGQPKHVRRILEMLQEGHTHQVIAAEVGMSMKFIQRLVQRLHERHGTK